jgi:hypothetical protein
MANKDKPHHSDIISAAFLGNFNDFKKVYSRLKSQEPKNCRQIDSFGESWGGQHDGRGLSSHSDKTDQRQSTHRGRIRP